MMNNNGRSDPYSSSNNRLVNSKVLYSIDTEEKFYNTNIDDEMKDEDPEFNEQHQ